MTKVILVLVTCGLLAFASSASAECAWVLWLFATPHEGPNIWAVVDAFGTEEACRKGAQVTDEKIKSSKPSGAGMQLTYPRCLPDTVDPRGLKGNKP